MDAEKSKEGQTPENLLGESVPQDSIIPKRWTQQDGDSVIEKGREIGKGKENKKYRKEIERERVEDEERKEKATKKD